MQATWNMECIIFIQIGFSKYLRNYSNRVTCSKDRIFLLSLNSRIKFSLVFIMKGLTLTFIFSLTPHLGLGCRVAPKFCGVVYANGTYDIVQAIAGYCPPSEIKPTEPIEPCQCGQANRNKRGLVVVGGEETEANEYPWQVGLVSRTGKIPWCGGSLISKRHVLTAAHCTFGKSPSQVGVLVGEHDTSDSVADIRDVSVITNHPDYSPSNLVNDISIITLSSDISITRTISPICLPWKTTKTFAGDVATLTGWGRVSGGGPLSPTLQEADITVASNSDCRNSYSTSSWPIQELVESIYTGCL